MRKKPDKRTWRYTARNGTDWFSRWLKQQPRVIENRILAERKKQWTSES